MGCGICCCCAGARCLGGVHPLDPQCPLEHLTNRRELTVAELGRCFLTRIVVVGDPAFILVVVDALDDPLAALVLKLEPSLEPSLEPP